MPKTKKKTPKTSKPKDTAATSRSTMIFKSLTAFFATTTICLAGFALFLFFNQKTPLESKKIQAFEPMILESIEEVSKLAENKNKEARAIDIGIDSNNNLYIDGVTLELDEIGIPLKFTRNRVIFKCDKFDGRVIGVNTKSNCKSDSVYGEPEYVETSVREHFQEVYQQIQTYNKEFMDEIKAAYGEGNYIEHEDGTWEQNTDDLSEEEMDEISERLAKVREKYGERADELEEYEGMIEKVWTDYLNKQ